MFFDYTYILVLIGALICAAASMNVSSTYRRYSTLRNYRGITSQEVAMNILHDSGIYDVRIERINGELTDHYSPNEKVLRLSDSVYNSTSVAALGVAAHECGHAIQHKVGYAPLKLRSLSVPLANIGSFISWPLILIGIIIGSAGLAELGVIFFLFVIAFQVITLPVEFDASHRALKVLEGDHILSDNELKGARKVLSAAAMTYVAAVVSSLLQLLRFMILINGDRRRR